MVLWCVPPASCRLSRGHLAHVPFSSRGARRPPHSRRDGGVTACHDALNVAAPGSRSFPERGCPRHLLGMRQKRKFPDMQVSSSGQEGTPVVAAPFREELTTAGEEDVEKGGGNPFGAPGAWRALWFPIPAGRRACGAVTRDLRRQQPGHCLRFRFPVDRLAGRVIIIRAFAARTRSSDETSEMDEVPCGIDRL